MRKKTLHIAGEAGIFGEMLKDLKVPYEPHSSVGRETSAADWVISDQLEWADLITESDATSNAMRLRPCRRHSLIAGTSHATVSRGKLTYTEPGPDLLERVRGESCIATSTLSILPDVGSALPRPDYIMTVSVKFETDRIGHDVLETLRREWETLKGGYPSEPLGFLARFYGRSVLLSPDGSDGAMMSLGEITRWRSDELKGLLEIAGYR